MTVSALLASIALFAPLPSVSITVLPQTPCPTAATPASCITEDGTLYLLTPLNGSLDARMEVAHELGHLWDRETLDDAARARYAAMVGQSGPWLWPDGQYDLDHTHPPAGERFADAFALCALGPRRRARLRNLPGYPRHSDLGLYGERIPRAQLANTCWLLHHPPAPTP